MAVAVVVVVNPDIIVAVEPVVISTVVVVVAAAVVGIGVINAGTEKDGTEQRQEQGQETFHEYGTVSAHTLFGESRHSQYRRQDGGSGNGAITTGSGKSL